MRTPWYVLPLGFSLRRAGTRGPANEDQEDDGDGAAPLLVMAPVAPRLPRRIHSRRKDTGD